MKNIKVGKKVEAHTGRCLGVIIYETRWFGEVTKVNKKSIRVKLHESVNTKSGKEVSRWNENKELSYKFWKTTDDGRDLYKSDSGLYGTIAI